MVALRMSLPVIIDTDPGIDDALALLLALRSPELVVRAVVTVYGNTTLPHATRNAQVIAQWAGARVPVIAGADRIDIDKRHSALFNMPFNYFNSFFDFLRVIRRSVNIYN